MPSSGVRIAVWPDADQPLRIGRAVLRDPAVVGLHVGALVGEVLVVAEHHADRRVEHLGGDAVAVLVGGPQPRIPAARDTSPRTAR